MTTSLIKDYYELICLTRQFLVQEHSVAIAPQQPVKPAPVVPAPELRPILLPEVRHEAALEKPAPAPLPKPVTPPQIEKPAQPPQDRSVIALEPMQQPENLVWKELGGFMQREFSGVAITQEIPSDEAAKKVKNSWRDALTPTDVVLLSFQEPPRQSAFLTQVANAIAVSHRPAKLLSALKIEQENGWDAFLTDSKLKLIIASDYAIYNLPQLMRHYRESSKTAEYFLGNVPLFLLADLSLYLREPLLKASLWKALSRIL
jgi:hypothetical protein